MQQYSITTFANNKDLKVKHMAYFLASIGVTVDKAETWQQWAAAYVDMGLIKHPEDPLLMEMRKALCYNPGPIFHFLPTSLFSRSRDIPPDQVT